MSIPYRTDLIGVKFNRLLVLNQNLEICNRRGFLCRCDCGAERIIRASSVIRGDVKSCGCILLEHLNSLSTHNMTRTKTYKTWISMKERCCNITNNQYYHYGGRGITICDHWLDSFENFIEDMGERPEGMSLDRIDVNGNYEPNNCRWATHKEQSRNKRNTVYLTICGITKSLAEWAESSGQEYQTLLQRRVRGYDDYEIVHGRLK